VMHATACLACEPPNLPRCCLLLQVWGAGTGIRRHRLFWLGFKLSDEQQPRQRLWQRLRGSKGMGKGSSKGGKGQGSGGSPTAAGPSQQLGKPSMGVSAGTFAEAAVSANGLDTAGEVEDESWAADYYGGYGGEGPLRSPQLPSMLAGMAGTSGSSGTAVPAVPLAVPRKPTSVKLAVPSDPHSLPLNSTSGGSGGGASLSRAATAGSGAGEEEAVEGPDVAAERVRAEALWRQW